MKRPTLELKERQKRIARRRAKARRRRERRAGDAPSSNSYKRPGELITAPRNFSLTRNGLEVVRFIDAIAHVVLTEKTAVRLDFSDTRMFYVSATILLFAEIDRIISVSDLPKPITIIDPRHSRPRQVLKQIGIYELTQDKCDIVPLREDVVFWKATKGFDESGDKMELLAGVTEEVNRDHPNQIQLSIVWPGVSEAANNAVEHGYKKPRRDGFSGLPDTRWWMFTQLRDSTFYVAVCDLGCGYRATIVDTIPAELRLSMSALFKNSNRDALAIRTAMKYGRTSTGERNRGRGSRDALSVLLKHGNGDLMIMSNGGWVQYEVVDGVVSTEREGSLGISMKGSIVWWRLPLKEAEYENG